MKLYDYPAAPNPRRVRIFMAEKGIEIPDQRIDLATREQMTPAFRAINPRCVVPTLVLDDGTVLCESVAICRYLEEIRPDPPLMGIDAKDKALVTMWERRMEFDGFQAVTEAFRNFTRGFVDRALVGPHDYAQIPDLVERGRRRLRDFYADLNERLANSPFVAGDRFTIADITAFVTIEFATTRMKAGFADNLAGLASWHAAMLERPSIGAASP